MVPSTNIAPDKGRTRLVLVCGPWSSGTSAVAGMLARAGLFAPGPYFRTNDPKTPDTTEMLAFREALLKCASEQKLSRIANSAKILEILQEFRDGPLKAARQGAGIHDDTPTVLKHGLAAFVLPELSSLFDLKIIGVLRPFSEIESTRLRRRWVENFGKLGASKIYSYMFDYMINNSTPFYLAKFDNLKSNSKKFLESVLDFCEVNASKDSINSALSFVER